MADDKTTVTIEVTGDTEALQKALKEANGDITKFAQSVAAQGDKAGTKFGETLGGSAKGGLKAISDSFDKVVAGAEGGFSGLASSFISLAVNPITLALVGLGASVAAAFQFAKIGEENEKIAKNFKAFATDAGLDAEVLKTKISKISEGFVDLEDILPRASDAIIGLGKNANKVPEILQLARNISVTTGKDIQQVFDDITKGVERQSEKVLRANGVWVDTKKAIQQYADANGLNVKTMSEAAKQQAVLNAVLETGAKKFGDTAKEAAPIQGGLKKMELAVDDVKDALGRLANGKFGEIIANSIAIAAQSVTSLADAVDRLSGKPLTLEQEYSKLNAQIERQVELAKLNPNLSEYYLKEAEALKEKRAAMDDQLNMQKLVQAEEERQANYRAALTEKEKTDAEAKKQQDTELLASKAEQYSIEQQMYSDHQIALATIEADGNANALSVRETVFQAQIEKNAAEYDAEVAKAAKIKDVKEKHAAEDIARAKFIANNQKAVDAQAVTDAKLVADAKLQIENNLFAAAKTLVDQQSALGKTIAVAEAIRNTYRGATLALATYPPPFGAVAAASTVALGLAQVAKITSANTGAVVTEGTPGVDNQPFLLSKGEIVAPAKSFDDVVEGTARQRGYVKGDENSETNDLLREVVAAILNNPKTAVTVNTDVVADENGINKLVEKIRDAIAFNSAPSLG